MSNTIDARSLESRLLERAEKAERERDAWREIVVALGEYEARQRAGDATVEAGEWRLIAEAQSATMGSIAAALVGRFTGDLAADVAKLRREYEGERARTLHVGLTGRAVFGDGHRHIDALVAALDEPVTP